MYILNDISMSINLFSRIFLFLTLPIWILLNMDINMSWILVPIVCMEEILIIVKYKEMQIMQLLMLYLFAYFLYLIPYFFFHYQLSEYSKFQNPVYYNKISFLFFLFYLGVLFVPFKDKYVVSRRLFDRVHIKISKGKKIIYYILILIALFVSMRQGQNVLVSDSSYELYRENLESVNGFPLYLILLLVFFPIINDWNKKNKIIFAGIMLIISLFCISRGIRMVLAPAVILVYMVFFEGTLSRKKFWLLMVVGYVFFIFVNALKMNAEMQITMLLSEGSEEMIISHHADILYSSAACFGLINDGTLSIMERIPLTFSFIIETIIPPSYISDEFKFPHIVNIHSETGGGGLFLSGAFLMWGYAGVLLFGYVITRILTKSYCSHTVGVLSILSSIVIIVFFPRWMSYDYHIILKFPFVGLILYIFICKKKF